MTTKEELQNMKPEAALQKLKDGNQRFVNGTNEERNILEEVKGTADGQSPFAIVLGCIDSRTPAETIFDQGMGDIFHTRIAGNVVDNDVLGGMEFACGVVGTPLIVVMGHTACGAVKGACDGVQLGHLSGLLSKIVPSVEKVKKNIDPNTPGFADNVAEANVERMVGEIPQQSEVLLDLIEKGKVSIQGAMYDVKNGEVKFLE